MAGSGQGYDLSVTTYSPDGRIFQIDYAQKCIDKGPTVLAFVCKDGVVLGAQKMKLSKMLVHGTNKRSYAISKTAGCVVAGMVPEGRNVLSQARYEAQTYKKNYGEVIPGYLLADRLGYYFHRYTLYASLRPLGTSCLMASYDKVDGPTLFCIEPSGLVQKWRGKSVGKGRQLANTEIEKLDLSNMTCKEGLFHAAKILNKVYDETRAFELELSWICEGSNWQHEIVAQDLTEDANKRAKDAIEAEEDEDA